MVWRSIGVAVALAAIASAKSASAQAFAWSLKVQPSAVGACITAQRLAEAVEARASAPAREPGATRMQIEVQIDARPQGEGFIASIRDNDAAGVAHGVRELSIERSDCGELEAALALVIASMVGVQAARAPTDATEPAGAVEPPTSPRQTVRFALSPDPAPPPARMRVVRWPTSTAESSPPWNLQLSVGGRVASGLMHDLAPGLRAGASMHWSGVQLYAGAIWYPAGTAAAGVNGQTQLLALLGELGLCATAARIGREAFSFCAGVQAGSMWDRTTGLWYASANQRALVLLTPSAQLGLPLTRTLILRGALGVSVPVVAPRYAYWDAEGVLRTHHSVQMGLFGELALAVRFDG